MKNDTTRMTADGAKRTTKPGPWWVVVNIYLVVIVLLAVAGSAIEIV